MFVLARDPNCFRNKSILNYFQGFASTQFFCQASIKVPTTTSPRLLERKAMAQRPCAGKWFFCVFHVYANSLLFQLEK